ncbi:MAG: 16S rRNA (guanine(527)-N(7))-methyltransferase RsmG [Proteobacteria bacterium]|nr:MAG: 16S rRNA (guanine(527)-N(7))-methyltransferase RsmG [Pseudomonadota bacterium]
MSDLLWTRGIAQLGIAISDSQLTQLKKYIELLQRWNKTYNLTAIRKMDDMIPAHIFDSLVVAPYIEGKNCLDVGSGAGLPGIPLAIIQPERHFTLLDTNGKKTRFIQQAIIELSLKNADVVQSRVESWKPDTLYDAIISRAFASISDFVNGCSMHLAKNGVFYAMKGQFPEDEMASLPKNFALESRHPLEVPYLVGERYLLKIINSQQ